MINILVIKILLLKGNLINILLLRILDILYTILHNLFVQFYNNFLNSTSKESRNIALSV